MNKEQKDELARLKTFTAKWGALGLEVGCTYSGKEKHIPNMVYPIWPSKNK